MLAVESARNRLPGTPLLRGLVDLVSRYRGHAEFGRDRVDPAPGGVEVHPAVGSTRRASLRPSCPRASLAKVIVPGMISRGYGDHRHPWHHRHLVRAAGRPGGHPVAEAGRVDRGALAFEGN